MRKFKFITGLLAISASAFILAGCADNTTQTTQTSVPKATEAKATEVATEQKETTASNTGTQAGASVQSVDAGESTLAGLDTSASATHVSAFSRTNGLWRLDGVEGTASIFMDGEGEFIAYYASGSVEAQGHMEYVDEYGDGNGRYDLIDESGNVFTSFYFDSDTQFHIGNNGSVVYILAEDANEDDVNYTPEAGVLVYSPGFTGLTPVETNNDYHGGYYYKDKTEDGLTVIVNTGFKGDYNVDTDSSIEDYVIRCMSMVDEGTAQEASVEQNEEQTSRTSWPVYYATWLTGGNEDTTDWTAMFILTDHYTYAYAFGTDADFAGEMKETWYEALDMVTLTFPSEEPSMQELVDSGFNAEDFFGCWEYTSLPAWVYIMGDGTYDWIDENGVYTSYGYYLEGTELVLQGNDIHLFFDESGLIDSSGSRLVPSVPPEAYDPSASSSDYTDRSSYGSDPGDTADSYSADSSYGEESYSGNPASDYSDISTGSDPGDYAAGSDPGEYGSAYASDPGDYGVDEDGMYDGSPVITSENFYGSWESAAGDGVLSIYGDGTYERSWWSDGSTSSGSYWMDGVTLCLDNGQTYYVNQDVIVQGDGTVFYTYAGY